MQDYHAENKLNPRTRRWVGITWGLLLLALAVLPSIDETLAQYRELGTLQAELATKSDLPQRTRRLADRVLQIQEEMEELESVLVTDQSVSLFKQDITRMANMSKCRVLSIRPGPVIRSPLNEILNPETKKLKKTSKKTDWEVEGSISLVMLEGTYNDIMNFLALLENDHRILTIESLSMHTSQDTDDKLTIEMNIKTYDLFRNK